MSQFPKFLQKKERAVVVRPLHAIFLWNLKAMAQQKGLLVENITDETFHFDATQKYSHKYESFWGYLPFVILIKIVIEAVVDSDTFVRKKYRKIPPSTFCPVFSNGNIL